MNKLKLIWMVVPVYLIMLMETVRVIEEGFLSSHVIWHEISMSLYNVYFSLIFLFFLKEYYVRVSGLKKKVFKFFSYIYLITAIVSTLIFIGYLFNIDVFGFWLIIILSWVAPGYGIFYALLFLPFPFLKKFKWSIFYTEDSKI